MNFKSAIVLLILVLGLRAADQPILPARLPGTAIEKPTQAAANENVAAQTPASEGNKVREHILTTQDKLTITVDQDPTPGKPIALVVTADGEVDVPVSRCCEQTITLKAAGKSVAQLENDIQQALAQDYYQNPRVQLRLAAGTARAGEVWINGGGVRQNQIRLRADRPTTLWEAVQLAQPGEFANLKNVRVQRLNSTTRKLESFTVNLEDVNKGKLEKDIVLQDNDRIYIKEKLFNL